MDNLTIVIPFYNGNKTIGRLLNSLPVNLPVIIVDDHSEEPPKVNANDRDLKIIRPEMKGYFTGASNSGIDACDTDVLILNQDVFFKGTKWLGLLQEKRDVYATIGEGIQGNHPAWPNGYIHGTFMFIRRDAWNEVGSMNMRDYPLWGSTCEWQLRAARKGFRALPLRVVPGMQHERTNNKASYGSAIAQVLKKQPRDRDWLIRTPPAISVVINCYNHGRYLEDAINSLIGGPTSLGNVKGQSFQSFEVIIVNDGSTDDTAEICNGLADRWKGIRCIHQDNRGSAAASNTGINAAYGKYIAMLDADDMMLPHRLEDMYRALDENPHSVIFDDLMIFKDGDLQRDKNGKPHAWRMPTYDYDLIIKKNTMHKGIMFPKKAWEEVGGYPEIMDKGREDWAFNVGLGRLGWCGVKVNKPGYLYRREGQNRTLRNTTPKWRAYFQSQLESLYPDIYSGRFPEMCCGKGRRDAANHRGSSKVGGNKMTAPGQAGMVKLEYVGLNVGDTTFHGPKTGTRYVFGGNRKVGYVDVRDAEDMLGKHRNGRPLFTEYVDVVKAAPVEYEPEEKLVELPEKEPADYELSEEEVVVKEKEYIDPGSLTVEELKEAAANWDKDQLEYAVSAENADRKRKGAIKELEELLNLYVPA